MTLEFSHKTLNTLYEAVVCFCWYKKQLRQFLTTCEVPNSFISKIDWNHKTKRDIVNDVFQEIKIHNNDTIRIGCFRRMANQLLKLNDNDIERNFIAVDDSFKRIKEAKYSISNLKSHIKEQEEENKKNISTNERFNELEIKKTFNNELNRLKQEYCDLFKTYEHQKRGYSLESILNQLFLLFELHSKSSFKIKGEQIDGSFSLDGTEYLLEAKWHNMPANNSDIYPFMQKVDGKLDNTLGFMISINGFTQDAIEALERGKRLNIILSDGNDLMQILEERISLPELIGAKKRHASRTGNSFCSINNILRGNF
jgi:hypothetical protein